MAAMGKFDKPILHGLCTYGISVRSVQQHFFEDTPELMTQATCRFTSHVFPGETLVVSAWKDKDTIVFASKTKERGKVACMGFVTLKSSAKL